jgi:hypothetical protein
VELMQACFIAFLDYHTDAYAVAWMATEPLVWISRAAVTLEIYRGVLESYRGIWVASRRFLAGALVLSVAIALATMGPEWRFSSDRYPILLGFSLAGKTVLFVLVLFLTLLFLFLAWYPIALRPNLVRYSAGIAVLFLLHASALWIRNVQGSSLVGLVNRLLLFCPPLVFGYWLIAFKQQGEQVAPLLRQKTAQVEKERLLAQLDQLNRALAGRGTAG